MSDEKSRQGQDGEGRGLPVGWGWADEGHRSLLYAPGKGGPDYNAIAYPDGTFGAYESHEGLSLIASAMGEGPPSTDRMAAAQREAEAALWRVDGFGVGEVRGARMMLGQQPTIVGADRLFCLMDLPGLWRVIRVPLNSEAIVEVDAVRAPVAPIRIAVGAPDPLGLGVGEHDAPGGEAPCSCGAWHREAVAEPAPVPLAALTGCDSHSVTPRASCAECNAIAEREEPSFRTGCAEHLRIWGRGCETCDRLRSGGEPAPREPSAPTDADPPRPLPDRAAWLLHPVSSTGRETIAASQYEELRAEAVALRARVAELEAERTASIAQEIDLRTRAAEAEAALRRTPPPGTVAALLLKVEEAERDATDCGAAPGSTEEARSVYMGQASGLREAARLITATLGAPTPLDLAVGEVCALLPREYPDGATEATRTTAAAEKIREQAGEIDERDEKITGLRARVAELEAANANADDTFSPPAEQRRERGPIRLISRTVAAPVVVEGEAEATPPPGTVATLLRAVEEARKAALDARDEYLVGSTYSRYDGEADAYQEAARLITAARLALDLLPPTFTARFAEALYASDDGKGSGALHALLAEVGGTPYDPENDPRYNGAGTATKKGGKR